MTSHYIIFPPTPSFITSYYPSHTSVKNLPLSPSPPLVWWSRGLPVTASSNLAGGVFIVIFVGIGLACVTLAFEYWWYKHRKGPRVTDSGRVLNVKSEMAKTNFTPEKSNFQAEYKY